MPRLIAIVGPTASGKSALGMEIAEAIGGEIIGADSRQIYTGLDIGTAKPTPADLSRVPHHLIDIIPPDAEFNLAFYIQQANQAIAEITGRGKTPVLVGGSGQYVWGLLEGWVIPKAVPDPAYRAELEAMAASDPDGLYARLLEVDPDAAARIDRRNLRRVIRALEVQRDTSKPFTAQIKKEAPSFDWLMIGLTLPRAELYEHIDRRVDAMIEAGLPDEVRTLMARYDAALPAMSGIGYKEMVAYINAEMSLDEAISAIKFATHRYVRRQYNWFRLKDPRINWFNSKTPPAEILLLVRGFIGQD
jgi:tRNA dimethylallyltransferase